MKYFSLSQADVDKLNDLDQRLRQDQAKRKLDLELLRRAKKSNKMCVGIDEVMRI